MWGPWALSIIACTSVLGAVMAGRTPAKPGAGPGKYDNSWCFKSVYDYDNCPEKGTLLACVRCCSELKTYYERPPSKNVCLAACADRFPRLGIEWIYP